MTANFETILFDFGGTLYSYASVNPPLREVIQEASVRLGSDKSRREVGRAYGKAFARAWEAAAGLPYYRHRDVMVEGYRFFADELGRHASDDFVDWMYETSRVVVLESFALRDDCLSTLESLRNLGLGLAIVSNIDDDYLFPMMFHDVKGAKAVGMTAALIVDDGVPAPGQGSDGVPDADFTIRRLSELLKIAAS
jgi:FMN phosphatase YigB (HAD superfamily)